MSTEQLKAGLESDAAFASYVRNTRGGFYETAAQMRADVLALLAEQKPVEPDVTSYCKHGVRWQVRCYTCNPLTMSDCLASTDCDFPLNK